MSRILHICTVNVIEQICGKAVCLCDVLLAMYCEARRDGSASWARARLVW